MKKKSFNLEILQDVLTAALWTENKSEPIVEPCGTPNLIKISEEALSSAEDTDVFVL